VTGRERILASLAGRAADRLPVDIGATEATGVSAEAYGPLKSGLGLSGGHTRVADPCLLTVRVERTFRERLGADAAGLFFEPRRWRPGRLPDGQDCLYPERWRADRTSDGGEVFRHPVAELVCRRRPGERVFRCEGLPLAECRTADDVAKKLQAIAFFDWPYHADETAPEFGARVRAVRAETEAALVLNCRLRLVGGALALRGEAFLGDLDANPAVADAILGRLADAYVARLTDVLPEVVGAADVVCVTEGPTEGLGVDLYRRRVRRHHERLFAHIRKTSGLPIVLALSGVEPALARELVELGADAVAPAAAEEGASRPVASLSDWRSELGRDVTLWGVGCRASILKSLEPAAVREEVRRAVDSAGGPARLVFAFPEPLPPGTRAENLLAAVEAAREMRP